MADESIGLGRALWRFVSFYGLRKRLGLVRAADRLFTGSASGISDAFDLHRDQLVRRYNELLDAVSQLEMVLESKRIELEKLADEQKDLLTKRDGALTRYEQATADDEKAKHKAAFDRFHARLKQIEVRNQELTADLKNQQGRMTGFERQLTTLQSEIQNLPADKAQAVADFVSNQKVIELNARLQGMHESFDRGPIDAVLAANRELAAKARVSDRIAGTDVRRQDQEYADASARTSADDDFNAMLAARRAEREAKTGAQPDKKDSGLPEL
jgi:hypothetical protein